ncbi:uncharacterized protein LOC128682604 [Plodia interpunctella]|uniref:uncharacterized protein LOC128682604 n=1 Tax=Plodia interpunctella TaxID=58824 RepID=UPI0023688E53|nr:uncharacterized protein LOC128682604 [Plodia interpunctella]
MLRTSVTKFRRACSLATIPRVLRGDVWSPASNFEKLSTNMMTKDKSTTSGSNDDEDAKGKKCKHLIELAFGPAKLDAAEKNEKVEVCKKDDLESMISSDIGKVTCEKSNTMETENNEPEAVPTCESGVNTRHPDEKCQRLIELVFGPDKSENQVYPNVSKLPELETENVAQMVTTGCTSSDTINSKNRLVNEGLCNNERDSKQANVHDVLNATAVEDEEKLVQKIEKIEESPLVEADINKKRQLLSYIKHGVTKGRHMKDNQSVLQELAKRCIDSSNEKINDKILKDMKRLGISQPLLEDLPTDNSEKATLKSNETLRDKENIKTGRRYFGSRRATKNMAMRMTSGNLSEVTSETNKQDTTLITDNSSRTERELSIDREKSPIVTEKIAANAVQFEKIDAEKTQFIHQPLLKTSEDCNDSSAVLNTQKEPKNENTQNEVAETQILKTSDENISTAEGPAVLVKESNDPYGFRITPLTPKAETLKGRLNALNNHIRHSTLISGSHYAQVEEHGKEQNSLGNEFSSSILTKDIQKIFSEERIPRHLFANLTVISKNIPTDTEFGKSLKDFYDQDLDDDSTLIKPDRLQYYSHNDEIVQFRDCSEELDPHVMIRSYEDTEPDDSYSNYYSDYKSQSNMYYGNMFQNNLPPSNSGMFHNKTGYNSIMTNAVTPGYSQDYYNTDNTDSDNMYPENVKVTSDHDYNPNQVLFDPYGKNMKAYDDEEIEDSSQSVKKNENNHNSDLAIFTSTVVNDGTLVSGDDPKIDDNEVKDKNIDQQKREPEKLLYPWIDKSAVASTIKCNAYIEAQEPVSESPVITPKEENMSLSEMLKRVRQRARLEAYREEVLIAPPVTEVDPTEGACKKPKPPCPPPQKTCPPDPPKCPPSNCPEPKPPCPKPCKPACPDPCPTPKCPPAPKKDPCAKFVNQKTVDIMGLVVTLGTVNIPQANAADERSILEDNNVMPLIVDDILLKLHSITDGVLADLRNKDLLEKEKEYMSDTLLDRSYYFPKDFEPWTPIPSWPIPSKRLKKKIECPQKCRPTPPPPPGARCRNIHHPCAGFPNDKKRT